MQPRKHASTLNTRAVITETLQAHEHVSTQAHEARKYVNMKASQARDLADSSTQ